MAWQSTPYTVPLLFAAAVSLALVLVAANRLRSGRRIRTTRALVLVALSTTLYAGAYGIQLAIADLPGKLLLTRVTWVGIAGLSVAWPSFVVVYAAGERSPNRRLLAAIAAPAVVVVGAAWFRLPLLYSSVGLDASGEFATLGTTPGPLLALFLVYTYALDVAALAILAREVLQSRGVVRRQASLLFAAGIVPLAGSLLTVSGLSPAGRVDLTPLLFALTTPLVGWAVLRYRLLDVAPLVYERLFEELGDGVIVVDADSRIVSLDGAATRVVAADTALGDPVDRAFADRPGLLDALDGKEDRVELAVGGGRDAAGTGTENGDRRQYEATVSALAGPGSRPGRMIVLHDVTDHRRTERRFRALIEKSTNTISVLDEAGRVQYASPSHERLLGYDPESLVGRSALDLVHPQDRSQVVDRFRSVLRGSSGDRVEFRIRHEDGSWRTFEGTMDDQLDDPDVEGIILSCHDVTERRGHEQRLQVLNRVLRHDVRNDVNVVDGYAELLADLHDDPTTASYVDVIRGKTADLVSLSDKARQLDEALTHEGGSEPVDLAPIVRRRIDALRREYPHAHIEVDLAEQAWAVADPLVGSVVDNVLENAVEHNDNRSPAVTVSLRRVEYDGEWSVELRVADDGPAIPGPDRRVLESGAETQLEHASGLGLWLVNWLVTESGGDLELRENDPRGNVVLVRLPATASASGTAAPSVESEERE